jgi:PKD repeat protein
LRCYDVRGGIGTTNLTIDVGGINQPPTAKASATPVSGSVPLTVRFSSAGSTDPDGTIKSYQWDFGDAMGSSTLANPTYTYQYAGTYAATLTVWDRNNASASDRVTIVVNPAGNTVLRSTAINLTGRVRGRQVSVTGDVVVKNAAGASVSGAVVSARWTKPGGTTVSQTATTGSTGNARFSTSGNRGTYTLTLTNIAKTGCTFDSANSVLTGSITK